MSAVQPAATPEKRYLDQKQRKHLERRVAAVTAKRKRAAWLARNDVAMPAEVKRAATQAAKFNKIVEAFDAKRRKSYDALVEKIEHDSRKCEESINFASPDEALRIVQQFERGAA